jgi:chromosome segregation ATPase
LKVRIKTLEEEKDELEVNVTDKRKRTKIMEEDLSEVRQEMLEVQSEIDILKVFFF